MVHDLSPFIFKITDTFGPRWYGFAYMLGFICAYYLIRWLANRQQSELTDQHVSDFIFYVALGTLVGGRLGYCVFYDQELLWSFSSSVPFWKVLAVHEGGMASHGGIIGIIVAAGLFAKKHRLNWVYLLDLVAIAGPVGVFFGRIANFINGELVGRVAPDTFKYGVKFPTDILNWPNYETSRLSSLAPVVEKLNITSDKWSEMLAQLNSDMGIRSQVYGLLNKIVEDIQNGNTAIKQAIAPLLDYRYPSQLIAAATEGLITFIILFFLARKDRKPGFIAGSFVICYAIMRIFNESFRLPDLHIGYQLFGLTRGQWLSVVMLLVGFGAIVYWSKTQSHTVHGWLKGENVRLSKRRLR